MPVSETTLLLDPEAGVSLKTEPAAKTPLVAAAPMSKKFLYVVALVGFVAGTATITATPRVAAKFWIVMNGSGCTTNQHFGPDVTLGGSAAGCKEVPADTPEPGSVKPAAPAPAAHDSGHEHETTTRDEALALPGSDMELAVGTGCDPSCCESEWVSCCYNPVSCTYSPGQYPGR